MKRSTFYLIGMLVGFFCILMNFAGYLREYVAGDVIIFNAPEQARNSPENRP